MKFTPRLLSTVNPWRESATLLLATPTRVNNQPTLAYLTMVRSKKSKFMPGGLVFPGGTVSPIDSSTSWSELYANAGINLQNMNFCSPNAHQPPMYVEGREERLANNLLPQDITLRITAIRETFEECGILLGKHMRKDAAVGNPPELSDEQEISKWQEKVKKNPDEFLTLCKQLSVVPDLASLVDWSNWLTPVTFKKLRFDTLFFMTIVPSPLPVVIDKYEAESAEWSSAAQLIDKHIEGKHNLMPPQMYELTRLRNVHSADELSKLMEFRRQLGIERCCPHLVHTKDGVLSFLPGDEHYPENYNVREYQEIQDFDVDTKSDGGKHHRGNLVPGGNNNPGVDVNIPPRYGQYYSLPRSKV